MEKKKADKVNLQRKIERNLLKEVKKRKLKAEDKVSKEK